MELSQVLTLNSLSKWSPNGELLACVNENIVKLLPIGDPATGQVFAVSGTIEKFSWAPDSSSFCCLVSGTVHVFSLANSTRVSKVEDPQLPIVAVEWTPDSRYVITASDCGIRLSIWRVDEGTERDEVPVLTCRRPKYPLTAGHAFTSSGSLWAVCTRVEGVESLELFACPTAAKADWKIFKKFRMKTIDMQELLWTPEENIVVWDSALYKCKVFVYHVSGQLLHQVANFPVDDALSICQVKLHAPSRLLAIGFSDASIRLLSVDHWREEDFSPLIHEKKICLKKNLLVLKEELRYPPEEETEDKAEQKEILPNTSFLSPRKNIPSANRDKHRHWSSSASAAEGATVFRRVGASREESSSSDSSAREEESCCRDGEHPSSSDVCKSLENNEKKKKKNRFYFLLPSKKRDTASSSSSPLMSLCPPGSSSSSTFRRDTSPHERKTKENCFYFPVEKEKPLFPEGILLLRFSPCGTFLASTNAEHPTVVFIWNLNNGKIESVLIHRSPVKQIQWNPHPAATSRAACLAISTGDPRIFIWTAPWQSVIELPRIDRLRCREVQWSSQGETLLLQDKGKGILLYPSFLYALPSSHDVGV